MISLVAASNARNDILSYKYKITSDNFKLILVD